MDSLRRFEAAMNAEIQRDTALAQIRGVVAKWAPRTPTPNHLAQLIERLLPWDKRGRLDSAQTTVLRRFLVRLARSEERQDYRQAIEQTSVLREAPGLVASQRSLRPGDSIVLQEENSWRSSSLLRDSIRIEIGRVEALGTQDEPRLQELDTLWAIRRPGHRDAWRLERPLPTPGLWRLSPLLDDGFRESFVQVSWLDAVVLHDQNRLVVWGSSPADTLPSPYLVRIRHDDGRWSTHSTDDRGSLELPLRDSDLRNARVVLEKNGNQALLLSRVYGIQDDRVPFAWTDRPTYRPGDLVHLRGLLLKRLPSGELRVDHADSVRVTLKGSNVSLARKVALDASGQFSDTLRLSPDAREDIVTIFVEEAFYEGRNLSRSLYRSKNFHFLVKAYRKPEFEVSAQPDHPVVSLDDTATLDIEGRYLFGGAMSNAEVKVRWTRPSRSYWGDDDGELFLMQDTVLDGQGKAHLRIPTHGLSAWETLKAEVIVTDPSRREERVETFLQIWPTELQVEVETTPATNLVQGRDARVTIRTKDRKLRPVSGPVKVRLSNERELLVDTLLVSDSLGECSLGYRPASPGSLSLEIAARAPSGRWSLHRRDLQVVDPDAATDQEGELRFDREIAAPGDTLTVSVHSFVPGRRLLVSARGRDLAHWSLPVAPAQGTPLQVRIPLPATLSPQATIEVFVERPEGMTVQSRTLRLVDSASILKVSIQARKVLFPGDTLKARLVVRDHEGRPVRGRFSLSLADDALWQVAMKDPAWRAFARNTRLLDLPEQVSDQAVSVAQGRYEEAAWDRHLLRSAGLEMPAQWERWPTRPKIRAKAIARPATKKSRSRGRSRQREEATASSAEMELASGNIAGYLDNPQAVYILQEDQTSSPPEPPATGGPAPLAQPTRIRRDFRDLAFWSDSIVTDANGQAELSVPMPDDLTRWRLVLRGTDGVAGLLEAEETFQTRTELMVKVEAPRALVETDSFLVGTVVHNLGTRAKTVQVELKLEGTSGRLVGPSQRTLDVPAEGTLALEWPIQVVAPGTLSFQAVARTTEQADAEARSWPVLVHGIPQSSTLAGRLELGPSGKGARELSLAFSDSARRDGRVLHLEASPTLAHLLFGSLDYLTGFPYGCVEQTLSRFVPNLIVSSVTRKLGMRNDSLEAHIVQWDSAGIERLAKFQHGDGGWGWWETDATDPRMTVLALEGLRRAKAEIEIRRDRGTDEQVRKIRLMLYKGDMALRALLDRDELEPTLRAQALRVLALVDDRADSTRIQRNLRRVWKARADLDASGLAYLLEAATAAGARDIATESVEMLEGVARPDSGSLDEQGRPSLHWGGHRTWSWGGDEVEATASVVRALARTGRSRSLVERTIPWLAQRRTSGYWNSTKTTARVVEALALALETSGELRARGTARVTVDGKEVARIRVDSSNIGSAKIALDLPVSSQASNTKVRFEFEGRGRLYWNATRRWITAESPIAARSGALKVTRTYTRLVYEQGQDGQGIVLRKPFEGELSPGDELEVRIDLEASRSAEHLLLEDWFPQGMEVLEKPEAWISRWCGWWWRGYTHKDARDDHVAWFLSDVHPGTTTFTYLLRAERPGLYHALPARAELMYDPKVKANSAESVVRIRAK